MGKRQQMAIAAYDQLGKGYMARRRPDPRLEAAIHGALGDARSVINVGAGAGAYEPHDRAVLALEPSETMIRQRPAGAALCVQGVAEEIPAAAGAFDCAMAVLTLHHWTDWRRGLKELRRVARRVVIVTFDPEESNFWLADDYLPELLAVDRARFPSPSEIAAVLGGGTIAALPIPHDCTDGFQCAYWRRPEKYLDPQVRQSISTFSLIGDPTDGLTQLAEDLTSRHWHKRNAKILNLDSLDLGYRLIQSGPP
jgi:SAM-dependent methyltransferase